MLSLNECSLFGVWLLEFQLFVTNKFVLISEVKVFERVDSPSLPYFEYVWNRVWLLSFKLIISLMSFYSARFSLCFVAFTNGYSLSEVWTGFWGAVGVLWFGSFFLAVALLCWVGGYLLLEWICGDQWGEGSWEVWCSSALFWALISWPAMSFVKNYILFLWH